MRKSEWTIVVIEADIKWFGLIGFDAKQVTLAEWGEIFSESDPYIPRKCAFTNKILHQRIDLDQFN